VLGPLSATVDGVRLFYRAVLGARPWDVDPACPRMKWDDEAYLAGRAQGKGMGKKRFGIMWDDGIVLPTPPVHRAMRLVQQALERAGHECVKWTPYKQQEANALLTRFSLLDAGVSVVSIIVTSFEASAHRAAPLQAEH
jgi:amidase